MKKRRIWSFLMAFFLLVTSVQMPVQAETGTVGMTGVTITDENRYEPQLYQKPEKFTLFPRAGHPMSGSNRRWKSVFWKD